MEKTLHNELRSLQIVRPQIKGEAAYEQHDYNIPDISENWVYLVKSY